MTNNHRLTLAAAWAVMLAVVPAVQGQSPAGAEDGWTPLFDGRSLHGWRGYRKPDASGLRWQVRDGALCLPPADGADTLGRRDIITTEKYTDFDLRWEWRVEVGSNSGVKYFVTEAHDAAIGHEYQIIDGAHRDAASEERRTASFYDVKAATGAEARPAGEWNESRVLVQGNHVEHWLNGRKVLEYELGSPEILALVRDSKFRDTPNFGTKVPGHILLQDHGDAICYRNVRIKVLASS
ncbi:MAG TPA: DUF1080 domain-containing protein [Vicinamibacterales bacterium]